MNMSLPDWQRNGWLTAHKSSLREGRDQFGAVDRDLEDSAINKIGTGRHEMKSSS